MKLNQIEIFRMTVNCTELSYLLPPVTSFKSTEMRLHLENLIHILENHLFLHKDTIYL